MRLVAVKKKKGLAEQEIKFLANLQQGESLNRKSVTPHDVARGTKKGKKGCVLESQPAGDRGRTTVDGEIEGKGGLSDWTSKKRSKTPPKKKKIYGSKGGSKA